MKISNGGHMVTKLENIKKGKTKKGIIIYTENQILKREEKDKDKFRQQRA